MPEFTAHYLLGEQTLERFSPEVFSIINESKCNYYAYIWGLQGPDLLFYSGILHDRGWLARSGSSIHHTAPDTVFSVLLRYITDQKGTPEYFVLFSYLCGFICHYALDSQTHPYIYHLAAKTGGQAITSRHIKIESEIGSILYHRFTGMPVSGFKLYEHYTASGNFIKPICGLYVYLLDQLFSKHISIKQVQNSFLHCLFLNRFTYLYARKNYNNIIKTMLFKSSKAILGRVKFIYSFIKSDNVERDTLNLMHNAWYNLSEPEIKRTESIPELFESAVIEAASLSRQCFEMLENGLITPLGLTESFVSGEPIKKNENNVLSKETAAGKV